MSESTETRIDRLSKELEWLEERLDKTMKVINARFKKIEQKRKWR